MQRCAETFAEWGWVLRSGHADGADLYFERGAMRKCEVYLPWAEYNRVWPCLAEVKLDEPTSTARNIAPQYHPNWPACSDGARLLHARNVHCVLGRDCNDPSAFLVCWTPNGSVDGSEAHSGGTGQALRIAKAYGVPVFNLANRGALFEVARHTLTLKGAS